MSKTVNNLDAVKIGDEEYRVLLKGVNGLAEFLVKVGEDLEYSMLCEVFAVTSWGPDDDPREIKEYLKAFINWDGRSNVWFGGVNEYSDTEVDGSRRRCGCLALWGKVGWELHAEVMTTLYGLAEESIEKFIKD